MTGRQKQFKEFQFSGVQKDIPVNMMPPDVYSDVLNMESSDVGMRTSRGIKAAFGTPLFAPEYLAYNKDPTQFYWLYAAGGGVGVTDGSSHFDISPAAPITSVWPTNWTHADLNNLLVINNEIDNPVWWNGATGNVMQQLPGWPTNTKAGAIRAYNNNLIAMDIRDNNGIFENLLMWSSSADPGLIPDSWTPLPENEAGFNTLADTPGTLFDGIQYRNNFMLFKEHSTYSMTFIGGNFVFAFRKLFATSGILTANCAAEYLGNVAVLTDGDFIMTDGQRADSLIDKRMRNWLFNNIDSDAYRTSFVVPYHSENQIWCCFPENGATEPTLALVWDATDNKYGIRELKPTPHIARGQVGSVTGVLDWDSDTEAWNDDVTAYDQAAFNPTEDALLQADRTNTFLHAVNESNTRDGEIIPCRVERSGLDFGNIERVKLIHDITPRITGTTGTVLTIRIGSTNNDSSPIQWEAPQQFIIGQQQKINTTTQGRLIAFKIESAADQPSWFVHGVAFTYDMQGRY